jgi:hypothetical protein
VIADGELKGVEDTYEAAVTRLLPLEQVFLNVLVYKAGNEHPLGRIGSASEQAERKVMNRRRRASPCSLCETVWPAKWTDAIRRVVSPKLFSPRHAAICVGLQPTMLSDNDRCC